MKTNTLRTITVAKLIEQLGMEDPDALVVFSCDYGDHSHTEQALPISGEVDEVKIGKSAYSNSGYEVFDEESEEFEDEGNMEIFVRLR